MKCSPRPGSGFRCRPPRRSRSSGLQRFPTIKQAHPAFVFLAEAYWGLESQLQRLGFDYTYDKVLYDGLVARDAEGVQRHLLGVTPEAVGQERPLP